MGAVNLGRFESGSAVWVSPCYSAEFVIEDEAVIMDDLGDGYIVLQVAERVPSYGSGHFVQDREVQPMMN